jgi:hypothetical protein
MMLKALLFAVAATAAAPAAIAGGSPPGGADLGPDDFRLDDKEVHVGNGGDVVVCKNDAGEIVSIELLDFYEARKRRQMTIDLGAPELDVEAKIELALARLERLDAGRAARYREWARTFREEALFTEDALRDIPDSQHVQLPRDANCSIEQIVVHTEPTFPEDPRYTVDAVLWGWLEEHGRNDDLAGLMLHELWYREGVGFGLTHSIGVRYMNSKIASTSYTDLDEATYVDYLQRIEFGSAFVQGLWIDLKAQRPSFYPGGVALWRARILDQQPYVIQGQPVSLFCDVSFFADGKIRDFSFLGSDDLTITSQGHAWSVFPYYFVDTPPACRDDQAPSARFATPDRLQEFEAGNDIESETGRHHLYVSGRIRLDPDGNLDRGTYVDSPEGRSSWVDINGTRCALAGGPVEFEGGELSEVRLRRCAVSMGRDSFYVEGNVSLESDGGIGSAYLPEGHQLMWIGSRLANIRGRCAEPTNGCRGFVSYDPRTRTLASATLAETTELWDADGRPATYTAGTTLELNERGWVLMAYGP